MVFLQPGEACKAGVRSEIGASIGIDDWARDYHLCDVCAEILRGLVERFVQGCVIRLCCEPEKEVSRG